MPISLDSAQHWGPSPISHTHKRIALLCSKARSGSRKKHISPGQNFTRLPSLISVSEAAQRDESDTIARAQDIIASNHASIKHDNDGDDGDDGDEEFPHLKYLQGYKSLELKHQNSKDKLFNPARSESDDSAGDSQGTKEKPVILDDDESDTYHAPNPKFALIPPLNASYDFTSGPSMPLPSAGRTQWDDIDDRWLINNDLCPLPRSKRDMPAGRLAQDQPRSYEHYVAQTQTRLSGEKFAQGTSDDLSIHTLAQDLDKDGDGWSESTIAELEKEVQMALEDQEIVTLPAQVTRCQIDQETLPSTTCDSRSPELECHSTPHTQRPHGGKPQEVAVEAMVGEQGKYCEYRDTYQQYESRGEKRQHQDDEEDTSNNFSQPAASVQSPDSNLEDDKDIQSTKRPKLLSVPIDMPPTPPPEQSPEPYLRMLHHRRTLSPTAQSEIENTQSRNDVRHVPDLLGNEEQPASQNSRSPQAIIQTAPIGEYHECAFQGFLKCVSMGNVKTYTLEFQLPSTFEHLKLPFNPDISTMMDILSPAANSHDSLSCSKIPPPVVQSRTRSNAWTPEEEQIVIDMKRDGASWEEIHDVLPHRSTGTIQVRYSTKLKYQAQLSIASEDKGSESNIVSEEVIVVSKDIKMPLMPVEVAGLTEAQRQEYEAFDEEDLTIDPVLRNIGRSERKAGRMSEEEDIHTDEEE